MDVVTHLPPDEAKKGARAVAVSLFLIPAAVELCRASLGDKEMWAATADLRDAVTAVVGEPYPWPSEGGVDA